MRRKEKQRSHLPEGAWGSRQPRKATLSSHTRVFDDSIVEIEGQTNSSPYTVLPTSIWRSLRTESLVVAPVSCLVILSSSGPFSLPMT